MIKTVIRWAMLVSCVISDSVRRHKSLTLPGLDDETKIVTRSGVNFRRFLKEASPLQSMGNC